MIEILNLPFCHPEHRRLVSSVLLLLQTCMYSDSFSYPLALTASRAGGIV